MVGLVVKPLMRRPLYMRTVMSAESSVHPKDKALSGTQLGSKPWIKFFGDWPSVTSLLSRASRLAAKSLEFQLRILNGVCFLVKA